MYYRIYDEDNKDYISFVYNEESKKDIKEIMKPLLLDILSREDESEVTSLKWDQYCVKMKSLGYLIEQQPTPFPMESLETKAWEGYLEDLYEDDLDEDY